MTRRERIAEALTTRFAPLRLEIVDESHLHSGHSGARPEGETHFRVRIESDAFAGKSRIDRHRLVNSALDQELATGLHALSVQALAPGETPPERVRRLS